MKNHIVIEGEVYLRLEVIAEWYAVEVRWLEEVVEHGLVERRHQSDKTVAIAAVELDRLAQIVRLYFHQGVNLEGVALLLRS